MIMRVEQTSNLLNHHKVIALHSYYLGCLSLYEVKRLEDKSDEAIGLIAFA